MNVLLSCGQAHAVPGAEKTELWSVPEAFTESQIPGDLTGSLGMDLAAWARCVY